MNQEGIWIVGGGRFGQKAIKTLGRNRSRHRLVVIEKNPVVCAGLARQGIRIVCQDGISFLAERIIKTNALPQWIVPVIPVHVAYEWARLAVSPEFVFEPYPIPEQLLRKLPHPTRGAEGTVYMSHADFICPDRCAQAGDICTHTGRKRPPALNAGLANLNAAPFLSIVVFSRQLGPGVGGFTPQALLDILARIKSCTGPFLLSTACKFHGVMNGFVVRKQPPG